MTETKLEDALWQEDFPWDDPEVNPLRAGWYSLSSILARAIVPALDELIDNLHGYPEAVLEGEPTGRQVLVLNDDPDAGVDTWRSILVDIRNGFDAHLRAQELFMTEFDTREDYNQAHARLVEEREKGLALFAKWYDELWD